MPVPETVYQGTTFAADIVCHQYPPEVWSGELRLTRAGETDISLTGTDAGDGKTHIFTATPAVTDTWAAGQWNWAFIATDGTDAYLVQRGSLAVEEINGTATDLQAAKDKLTAAEAELEARVSGKPYMLNWRDSSITRMTTAELMDAIAYWRRKVNELQRAADLVCPTKTGNRRITYARF